MSTCKRCRLRAARESLGTRPPVSIAARALLILTALVIAAAAYMLGAIP